MGHYATKCPSKKSKKGSSEGLEGEVLASQFEMDFTLIAWMVSSMTSCVWYLDSGASFHMTGDKSLFSAFEEKDLKMCIEMGDDGRYSVSGVGTVAFQREHGAPLTLTVVMYVLGPKKNLVSVAMLEDKGYDVVFIKGKVFLRHIATGQTKRIGIQVKNLYRLDVDDCVALSTKAILVQSQDIGELWHRRLGHFDHGALKIMQKISTGLPKGKLEQKKDQTLTKFCEFKALVEKELGKKIKALRSDNGGEYVSQEFKDFCAAEGIKRELMAPHNAQQNGLAERKNRTIVGPARDEDTRGSFLW
eukprot:PITA_27289